MVLSGLKDATKLLSDVRKEDNSYPMSEIGRGDCLAYHMYLYLYSKGFTSAELEKMYMEPDSQEAKETEEKIGKVRQEFFDEIAFSKDTDRIAKMYVAGYKNLQEQNMNWLKEADSPQKLKDIAPKLELYGGSQSV